MKTQLGYFDKDFNVVKTVEVDIHAINSTDPMAFAYGVSRGMQYARRDQRMADLKSEELHGSLFRELAPEYLRGFLLGAKGFLVKEGTKFRKGTERSFFHLSNRIDPQTLNKT